MIYRYGSDSPKGAPPGIYIPEAGPEFRLGFQTTFKGVVLKNGGVVEHCLIGRGNINRFETLDDFDFYEASAGSNSFVSLSERAVSALRSAGVTLEHLLWASAPGNRRVALWKPSPVYEMRELGQRPPGNEDGFRVDKSRLGSESIYQVVKDNTMVQVVLDESFIDLCSALGLTRPPATAFMESDDFYEISYF